MINSCSSFGGEVQKKYLYKITELFYMSLSSLIEHYVVFCVP